MSRSNYDKPFYVDVGTSIVAIRCASNHDVVCRRDHIRSPFSIELMEKACDRMNKEAEQFYAPTGNVPALRVALLRCEAISQLPEIREQQCVKDMRNIVQYALAASL